MPINLTAPLAAADPEIAAQIHNEVVRQHEGLEMIASENFVSRAVLEAAGSVFTNKYAEGYPGKRYYGGCEFADAVENLARDRAKKIFGAEHANVQPHSGSQANAAAYMTLLEPGDTILGLDLAHGGHLTHGHRLNFSGKLYRVVGYQVRKDTETVDYDHLEEQAVAEKPKVIIGGGSAYPRQFDFARMRQIADKVGAKLVIDMAHFAGLVAGGVHPSPVPHAHVVTSTTHKTLRGPRAGLILCQQEFAAGIDRSVFPGQQGGPLVHVIAAKAVAFGEALQPEFKTYAAQVVANAKALAEAMQAAGYRVISGGTDTHLVLIDVFGRGMLGSEAEAALGVAGITVNKNAIPYDTNPPLKPSGIRIGSPALTTRGMKEPEMRTIAGWIAEALDHRSDEARLRAIRGRVAELAEQFPLYGWLRNK
jgi:glycine hydroxymethyltransferase